MPVRTLRPRSLSLAIHAAAMTLALAGAAPALLAAEAPAASSARSYDIAPGPLGRTLSAFASDNGVSLAFDPALTEAPQRRPARPLRAGRGAAPPAAGQRPGVAAAQRRQLHPGAGSHRWRAGTAILADHRPGRRCRDPARRVRRRPGGPWRAPGHAGQRRRNGCAIQHHQLHRQDHRAAAGAQRRRPATGQRSVGAGGRRARRPGGQLHDSRLQRAERRRRLQRPLWPAAVLAGTDRIRRARGSAQGTERPARRDFPRRQRRRHHQPGAQARRRPAADPRQRRLDPARPARHSPRHRPTLRREQRLRRALQRRLPQRRYRRRPSEPRVSHALPGPGLPWRAPAPVQRPAVPEGKPGRRGAPAADRPGTTHIPTLRTRRHASACAIPTWTRRITPWSTAASTTSPTT